MRSSRVSASASSFLFLCALLAGSAQAAGRRPPELSFSVSPSTVTAGRTLTVWMTASKPILDARLIDGSRETNFYPASTDTWRALWGVASQEKPGAKTLRVEARWEKGVLIATAAFAVEAGTYPISRIPLTKNQDKLITSGKLAEDSKALAALCARPREAKKRWEGYFVRPSSGVITSVFGARRAYGNRDPGPGHSGTDIGAPEGTPVSAPAGGRVVWAGWFDSFGGTVLLDHGQGVFTYYLHMREVKVQAQEEVGSGTLLGLMGKEGIATGPHVHWTMVVGGEKVDAMEWTERVFD
jgi:murein DD-endopeptidase MepM/ murein hydrolase activator NlpD